MLKSSQRYQKVRVFDPAKRQDFRIGEENAAPIFSSLEHECVVIQMTWVKDVIFKLGCITKPIPLQLLQAATVSHILRQTGINGFVCICPGCQLTRGMFGANAEPQSIGDSIICHDFSIEERTVASYLEEMTTKATYEEWIIGSTISKFEIIPAEISNWNRRSPDLIYVLAHFEDFGSVLSFNFEISELLICFRTFPEYATVISEVLAAFEVPKNPLG